MKKSELLARIEALETEVKMLRYELAQKPPVPVVVSPWREPRQWWQNPIICDTKTTTFTATTDPRVHRIGASV